MPKVKLAQYAKKEAPPIDWLWAAVLERKTVLGYDLKRMADVAGVTYETMRHYIRQSPWSWKANARRRVCDEFGLKPQVSVAMSDDPGIKVKDGRLSR
jgi:hypothetical protein